MQNIQLNIGDKIGFVSLANDIDGNDRINFFPVIEITTRDGERAYRYQYPDGEMSSAAIRQSDLQYHAVELQPRAASEATTGAKIICLNDRKAEFKTALKRGLNNDPEVYPDFEKDSFVVVNRTNKSEYRVRFEARGDGKTYAECGCRDFKNFSDKFI